MARICDNCENIYRRKDFKTMEASVRLSAVVNLNIKLEILGNVDICDDCMQKVSDKLRNEAKKFFSKFIEHHRNPRDKRREEHPEIFLNEDDESIIEEEKSEISKS